MKPDSEGKYHRTYGNYVVAKFYTKDIVKYRLSENNETIAFYERFDDALNEIKLRINNG